MGKTYTKIKHLPSHREGVSTWILPRDAMSTKSAAAMTLPGMTEPQVRASSVINEASNAVSHRFTLLREPWSLPDWVEAVRDKTKSNQQKFTALSY